MSNYTRNNLTGDLAPINAELEKVQQALADKLDRVPSVGQANQLKNVLDVNNNRMINLPPPSGPNDAARLVDVAASTGTSVLPVQTGQNNKYLKTDGATPFWSNVTKAEVGLSNVENTADALKPISTAQQTALNLKLNLEGMTTTSLINGTATYSADTIISTIGFAASGVGIGDWKQTGLTGQAVSQTPTQLNNALFNDGNGNQWALIGTLTSSKLGITTVAQLISIANNDTREFFVNSAISCAVRGILSRNSATITGIDGCLITMDGASAIADTNLIAVTANDATIQSLNITGGIAAQTSLGSLFNFSGVNPKFLKNIVKDTGDITAFFGPTCSNPIANGNNLTNCGTKNRLTADTADRRQGLAFMTCTSPTANENIMNGVGLDFISFATICTNVTCLDNTLDDNDSGAIYNSKTIGFTIARNKIGVGNGHGYDNIESSQGTLTDNTAKNRAASGLLLGKGCDRVTVTLNKLYDNGTGANSFTEGGICLLNDSTDGLTNITIKNNQCYDTRSGTASVTQVRGVISTGVTDKSNMKNIVIDNQQAQDYETSGATKDNQFLAEAIYHRVSSGNMIADAFKFVENNESIQRISTILHVHVVNTNHYISFLINGASPVIITDGSGIATNTDSGSGIAVFLDGTTYKMKNRYGATRFITANLT
jgi:hypothetical protein